MLCLKLLMLSHTRLGAKGLPRVWTADGQALLSYWYTGLIPSFQPRESGQVHFEGTVFMDSAAVSAGRRKEQRVAFGSRISKRRASSIRGEFTFSFGFGF